MFKRKRLMVSLVFLCVMALLFVGCGQPDEEEAAPEKTPVVEEVTITVASGGIGLELEMARSAAARFMELNPGIVVEILDTPGIVEDRLGLYLTFFEAESPEVDVFQIDVIWPGDLAEHFVDLNDFGAREVAGKHFPAIIENNTVDGRLVGIPWFTDAGLLFYRRDLLEKYDLEVPQTWEALEAAAEKIQAGERAAGNRDFWGYVWQGRSYEGLTCNALEWLVSNDGGTIISTDQVITVNNPNAIEIVDMAAGWVGTISPVGVTAMAEEDARAIWQAGNAAFMRNWPYAYALGQADDSPIRGKFGAAPLPAGRSGYGAATLGGWQLAVSKYSENPAEAAAVALFLASYEEQKYRAITGSLNPTIMALYEDAEVLAAAPFFGDLYRVFVNAVARPSTATSPQYAAVSDLFFRAVHSVLTGETDAATAFEILEIDLQDLTGFEVE